MTTVTNQEKLQKAKMRLIMTQPFFATLVLSTPIVEDVNIKHAATDGSSISINPEYLKTISVDEVKGLLCSAIMKIGNFHHLRRNGRDQTGWNKASDLAVNSIIKECKMLLPQESLIDDQYKGMSAEQIFRLIPVPPPAPKNDKGKPDKQQGQGKGKPQQQPGDSGAIEVKDAPQQTEGEKQQVEAKIKQKFAQAAAAAKRAGNMPAGLKEIVDNILKAKVNWHEVLARFISEIARNDYSYKKPNSRFIHTGFYLPSLYNEEPGRIVFILDVSYSVKSVMNLVNQFAGELQDAANEIKSPITVIYVNTDVTGTQEIEPDDHVKLDFEGGGGTKFSPGFNYIDEKCIDAKAIVYLTDGECNEYPKSHPDTPVLWAKYGSHKFNPPFGEVIEVE